ncbi:tRNA uridine-5-carboxymethylaminomethyl(34) synthesis GTPase MnmE [Dendrosporobacter sp. 1207_IL3150]|uniref:tRNA uridine-5-carboxymethylaminomethyl(34) synthesis GTPase MnmE n=1 Tax=Dendrosporobacter sp. 1207_IL3150 TaxID=3084054 RepID=UPI003FA5BE7C
MIQEDTISAVATAVGEGGIGIIRLSGSESIKIANKLFQGYRGKKAEQLESHKAAYGHIISLDNSVVDEVLLLVMKGPNSYTREDVVEIHCHGGPIPLRNILGLTLKAGARLAEPGEFTKRAFLNGRLDLTQAEAVIDVIRAKTDASLRMAVGNLSGQLSEKIRGLRNDILGMIAHLEAAIDFPEEDIEEIAAQDVEERVKVVRQAINYLLSTANTGRILREGLETVIIGKPNVGKSSLLNALLKEKRAIVTDIPGTTRDIIEEFVNIGGIPLKIIDTAGIRETDDVVEKIGVEKAKDFINRADLILMILDASKPLEEEDIEVLHLLKDKKAIILVNKSDLPTVINLNEIQDRLPGKTVLKISTIEGSGLSELEKIIADMVYGGQVQQSDGTFVNNVRQVELLRQTDNYLLEVLHTISAAMPPDCVVVDLRAAWDKLGEISGDTVGEDIIDQIFSQFCIGK